MDKRKGNTDLTEGKVWKVIVRFALPLLVGNLLQQFYNITDSIIVGMVLKILADILLPQSGSRTQ